MNLKNNPYPGLFIALGGIDGSGKSTLASEWIAPYFRNLGWETLLTYEPWFGGNVTDNDILLEKTITGKLSASLRLDAESLQGLFVENRRRHFAECIMPFLAQGAHRVVVSDRSYDGTLVYGKATAGKEAQERLLRKHAELPDFFLPDLFILLDIPVKVALARIGKDTKRGSTKHIFEKVQVLSLVREAYQELPSFLRSYGIEQEFLLIDGQDSFEDVFENIRPALHAFIARKFPILEEGQ